ncbi:hypothetical protein FRC17_007023 [Serendipita sp. 399]|nr:hypothetical protein FRC17_007023 [Serendipita sp. 399]
MGHIAAIDRTPVEIWWMILTFALWTWLLPDEDNRLVDDLLLFSQGCRSYAEYRRVEDIRRRLRLVCKSWNATLCDASIGLITSDSPDFIFPSMPTLPQAMRIESTVQYHCICRMKCPRDLISRAQLESLAATTDDSGSLESANEKLESARVILLWHKIQPQGAILDALQYAQRVRALECSGGFLCESQVPKLQGLFDKLTHLSISILSTTDMTIVPRLPRLHYLQLDLNLTHALPEGNYVPLSEWKFSQLTSLVLKGFIIDARHEEVLQFGLNHSAFLKNLILRYHIYHDGARRTPRIDIPHLRQFRRLEVLGVKLQALKETVIFGDLSGPSRLSLLLYDWINLYRVDQDGMMCITGQCVRLCTPPVSLFDEVILSQSWDRIHRLWDVALRRGTALRRRALSASTLFKELERQGIRVFDRDGVGFQDGDGRKFLERL